MFSREYLKAEKYYGDLKNFLRKETEEGENPASLAKSIFHVDPCTVRRWFDYHDIERKHKTRSRSIKPPKRILKNDYKFSSTNN